MNVPDPPSPVHESRRDRRQPHGYRSIRLPLLPSRMSGVGILFAVARTIVGVKLARMVSPEPTRGKWGGTKMIFRNRTKKRRFGPGRHEVPGGEPPLAGLLPPHGQAVDCAERGSAWDDVRH